MADTNTDNIYFAGFFDGEGSVAIYPKKYVVSLTNTDIRPLQRAQQIWGGKIYTQLKEYKKGAVQDIFRWQIYGHSSAPFLFSIRPHTIIKSAQIDVYLETLKSVPRGRGAKRVLGATSIISKSILKLKELKRCPM